MKKSWLVILSLFFVVFTKLVLANESAPSFPACGDKIFSEQGDKAHYDYGTHQIVGDGLVEGSDDVYSLGDGNALQCYCPVEGDGGIQTNWWNVEGVDQSTVDSYKNQGWLYEASGTVWNLNSGPYLAQNVNFSCSQPEVTPTPTSEEHHDPNDCGAKAECAGPASPPVCTDPQPDVPILLSVTRSGNDGVDLTWSEVGDAQYYLISYGLESGNPIYGVPDVGKVQAYHIGGLDLSKRYYFTVRAHRGCAPSEASNELAYPQVGGRVLGLATTGMDFNLLKWGLGMAMGVGAIGWGGWELKRKMVNW